MLNFLKKGAVNNKRLLKIDFLNYNPFATRIFIMQFSRIVQNFLMTPIVINHNCIFRMMYYILNLSNKIVINRQTYRMQNIRCKIYFVVLMLYILNHKKTNITKKRYAT